MFFIVDRVDLFFIVDVETDLVLVCGSKLTWFVWGIELDLISV